VPCEGEGLIEVRKGILNSNTHQDQEGKDMRELDEKSQEGRVGLVANWTVLVFPK
jgi:hypothetical protein